MSSGPFDCSTCGATHPRGCRAHKDQAKTIPCGNWPARGATVCRYHGGSAPQVKAAAEQRQAEAAAEQAVRALWSGLDQATPVKDPVSALERLAGALEQLVDEAGARVTGLKHVAGGEHLTQLRAEVVLFERALGHLRGLLVDMARLGIASRAVEVQQGQADQVLGWLRDGLEAGRALPVGTAPAVVVEVVLGGFLEAMRRSRAGVVVSGELEAGAAS